MQLWQRIAAQNGRLEIAMADFSFKPARSAQVQELTFEQLLDSDEAAALLRIHPKTLQKMARNGEISGVQVGRLWRFRASVLNEWLEHKMAS
jgi:excisionase family DNA binding protein